MASNTSQSQQYKITEAVISADRFLSAEYDVRTSIVELNIFETLDKPYITGQLVIVDDKGLFDFINFNGTERLKITIASVTNDLEPVMERGFIMTGVEQSRKANESGRTSVLTITLMDEHAFYSRSKRVSKSFRGKIDDIIVKLIASEMEKDVDLSYSQGISPVQQNIKGIIPNLNPIDAAIWLTKRASTINGCPYFIYGSMHDNNVRFGNLEVMLRQDAFNEKIPFTYNPANLATAEQQDDSVKSFIVKNMKTAKMSNTLKLIEQGLVGSEYANTNLNTGQIFRQHHSAKKTLDKLEQSQIIGDKQNVFDEDMTIGSNNPRKLDEINSVNFHTISSTGSYERHKSYHDEHDETRFKKKVETNTLKGLLYKNMFNVLVPGVGLIVAKAGVGDIVNLRVVNDNTEIGEGSTSDTMLDKNKSGDFLIYETRHIFSGTTHDVSMNVCKLERDA